MADERTSRYAIPITPTTCWHPKPCVYRDLAGVCDEPRINKGNYDAACHHLANKHVLPLLRIMTR